MSKHKDQSIEDILNEVDKAAKEDMKRDVPDLDKHGNKKSTKEDSTVDPEDMWSNKHISKAKENLEAARVKGGFGKKTWAGIKYFLVYTFAWSRKRTLNATIGIVSFVLVLAMFVSFAGTLSFAQVVSTNTTELHKVTASEMYRVQRVEKSYTTQVVAEGGDTINVQSKVYVTNSSKSSKGMGFVDTKTGRWYVPASMGSLIENSNLDGFLVFALTLIFFGVFSWYVRRKDNKYMRTRAVKIWVRVLLSAQCVMFAIYALFALMPVIA